jgi:phage-related minor tail protein
VPPFRDYVTLERALSAAIAAVVLMVGSWAIACRSVEAP